MSHPDVSIIIPCYNRSALVGEAIESALRQGPNVEVIVIDDGSTDASWEVISSFDRVRAVRTVNRGVSAARNEGIRLSIGRFIRFLDSDDTLPDGSTARLLEATARLNQKQIAVGAAVVSGNSSVEYGYASAIPQGTIAGGLLLRRVMPCVLPMYPRKVLTATGGFDEALTISEDYELAVRLHASGYNFVQVQIPSYMVREHGGARLSRHYGASGYEAQLRTLRKVAALVRSQEERRALGQVAWTLGRNASRQCLRREADKLFGFAHEVGGAAARVGTVAVRLLYSAFEPYTAERFVECAKTALGRQA